MMIALTILGIFLALVLACAVALALPRRSAMIGRRSCPPPPADPYSREFGDWPVVPMPQGSILDAHFPLTETEAREIRERWARAHRA